MISVFTFAEVFLMLHLECRSHGSGLMLTFSHTEIESTSSPCSIRRKRLLDHARLSCQTFLTAFF